MIRITPLSIEYRLGQPNPDSHSTTRVRIRQSMSERIFRIVSRIALLHQGSIVIATAAAVKKCDGHGLSFGWHGLLDHPH